jgi:hypothetical protein
MMRSLMAGLAALAFCACTAFAQQDDPKQVKGKISKFDPAQRIIKVKVGEREMTYKVRQDAEIVDQDDRQIPQQAQVEQVAPGAQVTLVTVDQGAAQGPQQVSKIKIKVVRIKKKPVPEQTPPDKPKTKTKTKPDQNTEQAPEQAPPDKPKTKTKTKPDQNTEQAPEQAPPDKPKTKSKPDQSPNQNPPKTKTKPEQTPPPDENKDKD